MDPVQAEIEPATVIARRLRAAALIALGSLVTFAAVDLYGQRAGREWSAIVKVAQMSIVLWTLVRLREPRPWHEVATVCLVFVASLLSSACLASSMRGDTTTLPVLIVMIVMASAVLVPWGIRHQSVLALVALGALGVQCALLGGVTAVFPFPGLPIVVTLAVSVFTAYELERHHHARREAEAALRESEQRFRTMAEDAPVLIWMTDATGHNVYLNNAWTRLVGQPLQIEDRLGIAPHVHPADIEQLGQTVRAALDSHGPWEAEYRLRDASGKYRWMAARGVPRYAAGGAFVGHFGIATDVTARKEEAAALAAAHQAALEATRLKTDFLATMSHEIRTPMHGIFGMTELAIDTDDVEERRDFLDRARGCARTLMTLLDEILDFSKIEAGRLELRTEDFDVRQVVHEVMDVVAVTASRKRLELLTAVDDAVPPRLCGDPVRFRQILTNLLGNAVKFTARGEVELRVDAASDAAGTMLRCRVRDSGIGIAPEKLTAIFEAFTQAERTIAEEHGGTGLGLAISQRLARLMGGGITVVSTPGAGSTFTFEARFETATRLAAGGEPLIVGLDGVRVLVVDDNTTNRLIVMKSLETRGCTVALASSGVEAFDLAQSWLRRGNPFDVMVLDVHMPGMDGAETARRFRAQTGLAAVPIVFLSSVESSVRALARELDGVWTLTKPVRQSELLRAVHEAVVSARRPSSMDVTAKRA
jgi:PAS domain S-box-containing protein